MDLSEECYCRFYEFGAFQVPFLLKRTKNVGFVCLSVGNILLLLLFIFLRTALDQTAELKGTPDLGITVDLFIKMFASLFDGRTSVDLNCVYLTVIFIRTL